VHGNLLPVEAIVLDRGRRAVGDARLGIAIEGDGVGGCGCAVRRIARGLQHTITSIVIQKTIAGRRTARGYLASHAPDGIVYLSVRN